MSQNDEVFAGVYSTFFDSAVGLLSGEQVQEHEVPKLLDAVAVSSEFVSERLQFGGSLNPKFVAGDGSEVSFNTWVFSADRFGVHV